MQLSIVVLVCCLYLFFVLGILRVKVNKRLFVFLWFCLIFCIGYITYHLQIQKQSSLLDLYRYYGEINSYRNMSMRSLISQMYSGGEPFRILLFGIISRLPDNRYLSLIVGVIVYILIGIFIYDAENKKSNMIGFYSVLLSMIASTAMIFYGEIVIGIRCALAYVIICFAYIIYVKRNKLLPISIFLGIIASMLHSTGFFVMLIIIMYEIFPQLFKFRWILLFWRLGIFPISALLMRSNIVIVNRLGRKISVYFESIYRHYLYWICMMVMLLLIQGGVDYLKKKQRLKCSINRNIIEVMSIFTILSLGGIVNLSGIRLMYIVAFLFPYFAKEFVACLQKDKRVFWFIGFVGSAGGLIIYNCLYFALQYNRAGAYWG